MLPGKYLLWWFLAHVSDGNFHKLHIFIWFLTSSQKAWETKYLIEGPPISKYCKTYRNLREKELRMAEAARDVVRWSENYQHLERFFVPSVFLKSLCKHSTWKHLVKISFQSVDQSQWKHLSKFHYLIHCLTIFGQW